MAKKFKINASDGSIKRYSDVVPQEKRRYWYFTTHGIGPGMLPSDVKILETKEGQNKKGTWGDFICLDSVLNTDELKAYDLIELAPDMVESACGSKKAVKSATRKPLRKQAVKASAKKAIEASDYITDQLIQNTKSKSLKDAYDNGDLSVVMKDDVFWFEHTPSDRIAKLAIKEIKRLYPNAKSLLEVGPKKPVKSSTKRRSVKASDVDADRPNSAPNSWKSSQRMAYKVTEDQTKGERTFPTSIDDVYKVLGEMQGTWTNPTTGWTGDCEIYERDLDDGSYIFSLVFGGNELEPDDILYVPGGFDYYSNKPKFTIYPHSGAPTFADSLEDFKRKLKKEYSYLRKVDDVNSACGKKKTVKASAVAKYKANRAIKAGINAPSTDGPLCVCENCKAEIESREGRQTVYNVISDLDIEPDERLICDWCEDEATELYQISPDDVEGAKKAVKCSFDEGDPWEYQESYDYYYDEEPPAHIAKELERLAKLTDMYQDRWFEKFEELHPGERFSSVDPHPDVDEAVGYTLDEAEYSPEEIKASTDVNASSAKAYYQITDEKLNIIDVANTEDEARAKALQILKDSGDEYYDIWYVDEDPDSIDDDVFIETVTASKSLNMQAGGDSPKAIKANDGIAPDDYDSVDDMISDGVQYDSTFDSSITDAVYRYINDNYNVYLSDVEYVEYTNPENWVVDCYQGSDAVESDFIWFIENNNTEIYDKLFYPKEYIEDPEMQAISDKLADTYAADNAIICNDFHVSFYPQNGQYSAPQVDLDEAELAKLGFSHEEYLELFALVGQYEAYCINAYRNINDTLGSFLEDLANEEVPIESSTDVNADLQLNKDSADRKKYNWGKNPITDLDGYVKDIADGVVDRFPNLTYEISDEAITFSDENNNVVYVQPIDEIVPEKEDLENDTEDLANAIQHEQEESDWYNQNTETGEDAFDYATRPVEMSTSDDELEPIMGDGFGEDDMGFGFDTSGEAISESMVDELCRIANEILDESELAKLGSWTDIDRDSFDYWCDGSSYVSEKFTITFTYTSELMTFNDFVKEDAWWTPSAEHGLGFNIQVKDGQVESVEYTDKYWVGNSTPLENAESIFDIERLEAYIAEIAAPVAMEIYNGTTNI